MAIISDTLSEALMAFFSVILVNLIMWIWTKIGTVLVLKSCCENEYNADDFAFELGYGSSLCAMLSSVDHGGAKGLFATLISTHPDSDERIARLQQRGAVYWINYGEDQTFCPICGTGYVPEAGFCTECGHRRDQAAY